MAKIFIEHLSDNYQDHIARGFSWIKPVKISSSDRIVIKPNLTFPTFRKGVMTNPDAIEGTIKYLKNFSDHIAICESDSGGYNEFSMKEVFHTIGLNEIAKRYDVEIINFSHCKSCTIPVSAGLRKLKVPFPEKLLNETDLFITMPVPKVHANTTISVGIKNQWGVIPYPSVRLKLHPYFKHVIYEVNKALPKSISIVDGRYGLTRNGPMRGDVVDLNYIVVGDSIFHTDLFITTLMNFKTNSIPYLKYIFKKESIEFDDIICNADPTDFRSDKFFLKRALTDIPGLLTFNSRLLAYIGYESFLSKSLHTLLYKFRTPFY